MMINSIKMQFTELLGKKTVIITYCILMGFMIVNFINNTDEAVLTLDETDCQELAYVYLNWKNDGKGYTRCQKCNKLIKQSKTRPRKYCEECAIITEKEHSKERVRRYREKCNENLTQQND